MASAADDPSVRTVGTRLILSGEPDGEIVEKPFGGQLNFVVFSSVPARDRTRDGRFVEFVFAEADGERVHLAVRFGHQRDQGTRVETAREKRTDWHVAA